MRARRLTPILLMVAIAACSSPDTVTEERTDALPTQLPAAEIPTYAKGDRYIYDNPYEVWTIVRIQEGMVTWQSSLGETRQTMFDPLLPPVGWRKSDSSGGNRQILEWSGGLFPLKSGNKLTYKSAVQVDGSAGHALFVWNCYAGNPRLLTVPAGDFATVPVYCRRSDGQKLQTYYAPALHNAASLVLTTPDGRETTRNLLSFEPGAGARVAGPRSESLPGGWSAAAIADWSSDGSGLPRVRPERVADANPPIGLAGPTDRSRNADELPPAETAPQRHLLALLGGRQATRPAAAAPHTDKEAAPPAPSEGQADGTAATAIPKIKAPAAPTPRKPAGAVIAAATPAGESAPVEQRAKAARYGAHVGSFSTKAGAERAWETFGKTSKVLETVETHTVLPINFGAPRGVLYRLFAGPTTSISDAKELCAAIKGEGAYCRVIALDD